MVDLESNTGTATRLMSGRDDVPALVAKPWERTRRNLVASGPTRVKVWPTVAGVPEPHRPCWPASRFTNARRALSSALVCTARSPMGRRCEVEAYSRPWEMIFELGVSQ